VAEAVLGLDPSLRRTGVALIERDGDRCTARTWVVATNGAGGDTLRQRYSQIGLIVRGVQAVADLVPVIALACIEAPSYGSASRSDWDRGAIWWMLVANLLDREVPVGTCAPKTRAKFAVGAGDADKDPVRAAMAQLWPAVPCTAPGKRYDECDALVLAHAAAEHLGWPVPIRRHHGPSLAVMRWPSVSRAGAR
jgi:Holliday junction resolvasome RuvABC endonuclease subunit